MSDTAVAPAGCSVAGLRGFEGGSAGQASEGGFVAASAWVGPDDIDLRGGDGAYPGLVKQLGSDGFDQFGDGCFQFCYFGGERADTPGQGPHSHLGGGVFVSGTRGWLTRSELVALGDQSGGGETSELVSEIDRRGYYQGFERVYGCYPGGLGALAGGFQYSEGFSVSPSAGYRRPASQRLAGGSSSVQRVGFGAVAGRVGIRTSICGSNGLGLVVMPPVSE